MISTYFPSKERGRHGDSVNGKYLRPGAGGSGCGKHYRAFGWHMVFIVLGIPGLFIAAGIYLFTRDNPKDHPAITQQDLAELAADDRAAYKTPALSRLKTC
jgi:sugar phosphate permease